MKVSYSFHILKLKLILYGEAHCRLEYLSVVLPMFSKFMKRRGVVYATSLTATVFTEGSVPRQESERTFINVLGYQFCLRFEFGMFPTVCYSWFSFSDKESISRLPQTLLSRY